MPITTSNGLASVWMPFCHEITLEVQVVLVDVNMFRASQIDGTGSC
jgi:hypothetical protein